MSVREVIKTTVNYLKSIKQRANLQYYSKMILHYKDNTKTWQIMKEVIGKDKLVNNSPPKHLILNNKNIFDQKTIANSFFFFYKYEFDTKQKIQ